MKHKQWLMPLQKQLLTMCTISEMRRRLKSLNVAKISEQAFNERKNDAADALREQWLMGEGGNGKFPDYSPNSIQKYGKRPGPWTLHDTGQLAAKIYFVAKGGLIESYSKDRKAEMIEERLSGNFQPMGIAKDLKPFQLNAESRGVLNPILKDAAIDLIKQKLQL